jgi:hypothetical protein
MALAQDTKEKGSFIGDCLGLGVVLRKGCPNNPKDAPSLLLTRLDPNRECGLLVVKLSGHEDGGSCAPSLPKSESSVFDSTLLLDCFAIPASVSLSNSLETSRPPKPKPTYDPE